MKIKALPPGHIDLPLPGVNEMFDLDGRVLLKGQLYEKTIFWNNILPGNGYSIWNSILEFPLTLSDPHERAAYTMRFVREPSLDRDPRVLSVQIRQLRC